MPETRVWSSRKFLSAWALTLIFTILLCVGMLTADAFSSCVSLVWIGYFAGNVGSKFAGKRNAD